MKEYWQTSMGYYCCCCKSVFLIGWFNFILERNYCNECKDNSVFPKETFIEKIY